MESGRLRRSSVNSNEIGSNLGARHNVIQYVGRILNATTNIYPFILPLGINIGIEEIVSISTKTPFGSYFDVYITTSSIFGITTEFDPFSFLKFVHHLGTCL